MNEQTLEFVVFCIESLAARLNKNPADIYCLLTKSTNLLNEYIIPFYEPLHSQSKDYIINELIEILQEKGVLE